MTIWRVRVRVMWVTIWYLNMSLNYLTHHELLVGVVLSVS